MSTYTLTRKRSVKGRVSAPYTLPDIPETTWAYIAGLVDGEGSFLLAARRQDGGIGWYRSLRLTITNTDLEMLEWVREQLGNGTMAARVRQPKTCYCLNITMRAALYAITPRLLMYMREQNKVAQAQAMLAWIESEYDFAVA